MKASELVKQLKFMIDRAGDLDVVLHGDDDVVLEPVYSICENIDENSTTFEFILLDKETTLAYL